MNKYKARKTVVDGIEFDSKKEANRYQELRLLEREGEIRNLRRQIKIPLLPAQKDRPDANERAVDYICDFIYTDEKTNRIIIEDVKGYRGGAAYATFVIKRKLLKWRYPQYIFKEI